MGKRFNSDEKQKIFEILQESYDVYGPKIYRGTGCFSDTDVVRYGQLESWEELVWDRKSDYSFKEALFPISETILYFTENEMKTADGPARPRMIFLKSCDFHALKRLDEMYLRNGAEDFYYRRMRENTVFAVMGCKESGESCFCVSMGTNRCEGYDIYAFQDENGCYVDVKSGELESLLPECGQSTEEEPVFVEKNQVQVDYTILKDIAVIAVFVFCVILQLSCFFTGGGLMQLLHTYNFRWFGVMAYCMPLILFLFITNL